MLRTDHRVGRRGWPCEGGYTLYGPRRRGSSVEGGSFDPIEVSKGFIVVGSDLLAAGNEFRQTVELAAAEGTLQIGNAIIVAEFLHFIIPWAEFRKRRPET